MIEAIVIKATMINAKFLLLLSLWPLSLLGAELCPLPSEQNVSYASIAKLNVASPVEIVSYGDDALQFAELWVPTTASQQRPAPVVILIHGGCWLSAYDIRHTHALSTALTDKGYAVWSLEYRRFGDDGGGWPSTFNDVIAGINALAELELLTIDMQNVALIGHSAGGHLALLAGNSPQLIPTPKIVIGLAPIVDLAEYARGDNSCQTATAQFMGAQPEQDPEAYRAANPSTGTARFKSVALHGDQDTIVPLSQSLSLDRVVVSGAGHFDFIHPSTPAFQALLKELATHL